MSAKTQDQDEWKFIFIRRLYLVNGKHERACECETNGGPHVTAEWLSLAAMAAATAATGKDQALYGFVYMYYNVYIIYVIDDTNKD